MITVERGYVHEIEFQSIDRGDGSVRDLARMRVNIDRSYRDGDNEDGSARYNHDRDFWINVEMWGVRTRAIKGIVNKGVRVLMIGRYDSSTWTDGESGEQRSRMIFVAREVAINPDSVRAMVVRKGGKKGGGDDAPEADAGGGEAV